jgi:hypothetical protein
VKDELTIVTTSEGSILLCNNRIVIPTTLQQRVVNIAHEGHMGIVKTKQLLREKVWFPAMNNLVESTLAQCLPCLASTPCNNTEPLRMTKIHILFCVWMTRNVVSRVVRSWLIRDGEIIWLQSESPSFDTSRGS